MHYVTVLGAGRIGRCIAELLSQRRDWHISLADRDEAALSQVSESIRCTKLDVSDPVALDAALAGQDAVISACQFFDNPQIAQAALRHGTSYFDLTEDVSTTNHVRKLSQSARRGQVFVPQCGLAPGYVGILGADVAAHFDTLETLKLRVGALPQMPNNAMLYNLTWSTEGLINEYCNLCDAIKDGKPTKVLPLEGLERFILDGARYEAFNTSGGLGTLSETLAGKVNDLTYKTIRYPGHRDLMDFLVHDLKLGEAGPRRELLMRIIEEAVPVTEQDVVVVLVSATGRKRGKFVQHSEHRRILAGSWWRPDWSGIQITTASSACAVLDLHFLGRLLRGDKDRGFVAQEEIALDHFMLSPYAAPFRAPVTQHNPGSA
ncbi:MAG TPA: saccharopine dehydrogenase NADP-binding domain-containing protein [Polyangiaceae bacterium]|nr:saccharopine dehydrogenase NADP-binding domain-containing protein [Polyangiaceae bacterium]